MISVFVQYYLIDVATNEKKEEKKRWHLLIILYILCCSRRFFFSTVNLNWRESFLIAFDTLCINDVYADIDRENETLLHVFIYIQFKRVESFVTCETELLNIRCDRSKCNWFLVRVQYDHDSEEIKRCFFLFTIIITWSINELVCSVESLESKNEELFHVTFL